MQFLWGSGGRLLLLPALTLLWANLHAGFLVGLLILGAFGAAELLGLAARSGARTLPRALLAQDSGARFRALLSAALLCLCAGLVTPYGPGTLLYPFRLLAQVKLAAEVQEWQRMPLSGNFAIFWVLTAFGVLVLVRSGLALARTGQLKGQMAQFLADAFLLAGFAVLAIRSVRHLSWFVLLVPPVLGYHLAAARNATGRLRAGDVLDRRRQTFYAGAALALALVMILRQLFGVADFGFGVREDRIPVRACKYLKDPQSGDLRCRLYNVYEWGGYLIWRFWPRRRVFIDGRCLVYGDEIIREALTVARGRHGWQDILRTHDVGAVMVRYRARDSSHFFRSGGWHCVYWDDTALIAVSEAVRKGMPEEARYFPLSNPAVFEDRLRESLPAEILRELEEVLRRNPDCWTALAERSRCLLEMAKAQPAERDSLLEEAFAAARHALRINSAAAEPWRALALCHQQAGQREKAGRAFRKANGLE